MVGIFFSFSVVYIVTVCLKTNSILNAVHSSNKQNKSQPRVAMLACNATTEEAETEDHCRLEVHLGHRTRLTCTTSPSGV